MKLNKFVISAKTEFEEATFNRNLSDKEIITPAKNLQN